MAKKQYALVTCWINGREVEQMVDVRASLTDMLRNDFRLTSVKKGCEVGECGACNVLIDGECFNSCIYLAVWAEGPSSKVSATYFVVSAASTGITSRLSTARTARNRRIIPPPSFFMFRPNAPISAILI